MHELSLAVALVEQADEILRREGGGRVAKVCVAIGDLSGVESEALEFAFPYAAEGTPVEGAELLIERVPAEIRCGECGESSALKSPIFRCSSCSSTDVEMVRGQELMITSLEIE